MKFQILIISVQIFFCSAALFSDKYNGPLTCYNETMIGGPLENPTVLASGCHGCLVCLDINGTKR